jgi:phosphatidate cytidylyltransferase
MVRILSAAVLLPALWATVKLAPPALFSAVVLLVTGIACWECLCMLETGGRRPFKAVALVAGLAVVWSFLDRTPRFGPELPLVAGAGLALVLAMRRRKQPAEMLRTAAYTMFPLVFVVLGLAFVAGLSRVGATGEDGEDLLMLLFVCVILADTAAYYVGSWIGRRALAPVLSPKKTWEGALAGVAASVLGALVAHEWFFQRLPLGDTLVLGVALGVAAILGDLAESTVKRANGVKDASCLVPGHGGLLDRLDSLLFAGPLLYFYYTWRLEGLW